MKSIQLNNNEILNAKQGMYINIPFKSNDSNYIFPEATIITEFTNEQISQTIDKNVSDILKSNLDNDCLYIGGGDIFSLPSQEIEKLLTAINFNGKEFTIEMTADEICEHEISLFNKHGINRTSLILQTLDDNLRKKFSLEGNLSDIKDTISVLQQNNIRIDATLTYGLPGQTVLSFLNDLQALIDLGIEHISAYEYEDGDQEAIESMYNVLQNKLSQEDYYRYEVSHFTKSGEVSLMNFIYWNAFNWTGIGAGSSGFETLDGDHFQTTTHGFPYNYTIERNFISEVDLYEQVVMMALNSVLGLNLDIELHEFAYYYFEEKIDSLISEGKLTKSGNSIVASELDTLNVIYNVLLNE